MLKDLLAPTRKTLNALLAISVLATLPLSGFSEANDATPQPEQIYWVGHSLVTGEDPHFDSDQPLPALLKTLAATQGHATHMHEHTQWGAPIQANWGQAEDIWPDGFSQLPPLVDPKHPQYGSFDRIILTEGVNLEATIDMWDSAFYARQFYCAATNANPDTKLYLYESWHHYQRSDEAFAKFYGSKSDWNFIRYNNRMSLLWTQIAMDASEYSWWDKPMGYSWPGEQPDPGHCTQKLDIRIIPTGPALVAMLKRIDHPKQGDDFSYDNAANGKTLSGLDFFVNPYLDFPTNSKTQHPGQADDIHPSHVLVYLNALVHYATLFETSPLGLPALNGVPPNLATIMQEVAWETVSTDPRTGVKAPSALKKTKPTSAE